MATSVVQKIANAGGVGIPVSLTTSMGATTTDGILLGATNTATAGAQVFSPALHFQGSGWKTNATAGAQSVDWKIEVQPVQGAASPDGQLVFSSSVNGGAYTARWTMDEVTGGASYGFFPGANTNTGLIPWTNTDLVVGVLASYHWRFTPYSSGSGSTPTLIGGVSNVFGWASSGGATNGVDTGISRFAAGVVQVGNGSATSAAGVIMATSHMRVPLTVATLPAGATRGYTCIVTDASNPTFLATVVGGASTITPVFYDGAAWKVG